MTSYTANLIYMNESGALNESMSDVFAALIDGDWLHGEDNWLNLAEAPAGRNLADPTNGGKYNPAQAIASVLKGHQPDHMNAKYTGADDNGGVHINNGIMNKAAYLIAVGGTHRGIKICTGLGRDVLGRLYYQALTHHLTPSSDFADMRDAVLDALQDLYAGDFALQQMAGEHHQRVRGCGGWHVGALSVHLLDCARHLPAIAPPDMSALTVHLRSRSNGLSAVTDTSVPAVTAHPMSSSAWHGLSAVTDTDLSAVTDTDLSTIADAGVPAIAQRGLFARARSHAVSS